VVEEVMANVSRRRWGIISTLAAVFSSISATRGHQARCVRLERFVPGLCVYLDLCPPLVAFETTR